METEKDVRVVLVELVCDSCGELMDMENHEVIWNNNSTTSLADDTISYKYSCSNINCSDIIISNILYPYPKYI